MKILFLGDSITQGAGASKQENCYVNLVGKSLGVEAINFGIGGTRIARQKDIDKSNANNNYDFNLRLVIAPDDIDFVVCMGGTNDFGHGSAPIGKKTDRTPFTFYGAVKLLHKTLIKKYGRKNVLIVLPIPTYGQNLGRGQCGCFKEDGSPILSVYKDVIKWSANKYGLATLDLENVIPEPMTRENSGLFFDGLHPNDNGHEVIAREIAIKISSMLQCCK